MSRVVATVCAGLLALCGGCATPPVASYADPHGHRLAVHKVPSSPEHVMNLQAHDPREFSWRIPVDSDEIVNPARTRVAVVGRMMHQHLSYQVPMLVLFKDGVPQVCLVSRSWPNRPMGRIAWLDDRLVAFDLMAGENMGWHYVVDALLGRTVHAAPFADE